MRILLTFAVGAEFAPWRSRHPFVPYEFDESGRKREFDLFRANIAASEVTVLLTGMGPENARNAMHTLPVRNYDVCISAGLAGALDQSLLPGNITVARTTQALDASSRSTSDAGLFAIAIATGATPVDVSLTCDTIISSADAKEALRASGNIVEMETTCILVDATRNQVPAVAVRSISDTAQETLEVDFQRLVDSRGHLKVAEFLKELALHPHRLSFLIRFGRQSRAAAKSLADFLDVYISAIEKHSQHTKLSSVEELTAT